MSSFERNTGTESCTSWCHKNCNCRGAGPVGSSQTRIDQGQHELVNSDAREIMEEQNEQNASNALQGMRTRASELEDQNRRSTWREEGTEQSDTGVLGELKQQLQEVTARVSKLEEASRSQKQEAKGLEEKAAGPSHLREETEASRRNEAELKQRLREVTEAFRRKETELNQRLREETEASHRKERESERLIAELELRLREKTEKLSNIEAFQRNPRYGESSDRLEAKVTKLETEVAELKVKVTQLEAKPSDVEDDARRWEQKNRDLSETNQKLRDEIDQLNARVKTLVERENKPLLQVLARKPDTIAMVDVEGMVRILNAQVEQVSSRIADQLYYRESPGSGTDSAALDDLRDYLGPWLFEALRRRLHESNPLIPPIVLETVMNQVSCRIMNHWNPPFWNDNSIFFRVHSHTREAGHISTGTWSAVAHTMSENEAQEVNVKYLSEMVVKAIAAVGGRLSDGQSLPTEHQEDVEDIVKRALEFRQIVSKEVKSMDFITYTVPSDTPFDPSQMNDTEGSVDATGCDRVVCTLQMGLRYRRKAELGRPGGGQQCGLTLKPKVVLPAALEA